MEMNKKTRCLFFTGSVLLAGLLIQSACRAEALPVMVGGNEELDACMSVGIVMPAKTAGGLAVYTAPAMSGQMIEQLPEGRFVWMCDEQQGWLGIVFPPSNEAFCDVTEPVMPRQAYQGKCQSGWVPSNALELVAG